MNNNGKISCIGLECKNADITIGQTLPNATITQAGNITRVACTVNGYSVLTTASAINPYFCCGKVNANGAKALPVRQVQEIILLTILQQHIQALTM